MSKPLFQFGNTVVVDEEQIGVIVKTWGNYKKGYHYEVYVRSYNVICEYNENKIDHYVYSKYLSKEEKEFY